MLSAEDSREALSKLFERRQIVDLETLFGTLKTTSRMSVFRRLSPLGYLTSYSHNGRYYTLPDIPDFDDDGLWRFQGVCFSREGSLKATLESLVHVSEAGRMHPELAVRLEVRVHNALLDLVRRRRISREQLGSLYLYVSAEPDKAAAQIARRSLIEGAESAARVVRLGPALVIEVLVEVVRGARVVPDPGAICERLATRSVSVTLQQVEDVYQFYRLKKTVGSPSPPSRR